MTKIKDWFQDRYYDCYFWIKDRPFARIRKGTILRLKNVCFVVKLLLLAVYSPMAFRNAIIDYMSKGDSR